MADTPLQIDPGELAQIGFSRIQSVYGDWQPADTDPASVLVQAFADMGSVVVERAVDVAENDIVAAVGRRVYNTQPFAATAATVASTWTANAPAPVGGTLIPAGTQVGLPTAADDGTLIGFEVVADVTIPEASTATGAGEVILVGLDAGATGSGLSGTVVVLDRLAAFDPGGVVTTGVSTNGVDAEATDAFVARIGQLAPLFAFRLIKPADYANAPRLLIPGVARALAIDGLNGDTLATGQERCVTAVLIDALGNPVSSLVKDAVLALFTAQREETFEGFVIDPTYTDVAVHFTAHARAGYDPTQAQADAIAALQQATSKATWGIPQGGQAYQWEDTPILRYQRASTALDNVLSIDHWDTLTLNAGTADVTLTGPGAIPNATVTGTVT